MALKVMQRRPVTRTQLVDTARSYIGTPFRFHGRDNKGMDCVGLLYCVCTDLGLDIEDNHEYTRNPESMDIPKYLDIYTDKMSLDDMKPGMIVKLRQSLFPMHLGFIAKDDTGRITIINANLKKRAVVEDPISEWKPLIMSVHDIKGVMP